MRKKISVSILLFLLCVIIFSLNVNAATFMEPFVSKKISREDMSYTPQKSSLLNSTTLSISSERSTGNSYKWNLGTVGDGKTVWKILNDNIISLQRDNNEVYLCLNATRGFGETQGQMAEGSKDEYTDILDMKLENNIENIKNYAGGSLENNYNNVIWILDNIYTPINSSEYRTNAQYIDLMKNAGIEISGQNWDITEEEIEVIEQMAIWYYTNSDNSDYNKNNLPSMYLNNNQISSIYYGTDEYGTQLDGRIKQENLNKLYRYYIQNADDNYKTAENSITLSNDLAIVNENDTYLYLGPFSVEKKNETVSNLKVYLNETELEDYNYSVVSSNMSVITDYNKMSSFYIKVDRSKIVTNSNIKIELISKYTTQALNFMTNSDDYLNTQPVVKVSKDTKTDNAITNIEINLVSKTVTKIWEDNNNQDKIRPEKVEVQLYKVVGNNKVSMGSDYKIELNENNNWTATWNALLEESNGNKITYIAEEKEVEGYITSYSSDTFTITNIHVPQLKNPYSVKLFKIGEDENTFLSGAWFKINNERAINISKNGNEISVGELTKEGIYQLKYSFEETISPVGYKKLENKIDLTFMIKVELINNNYEITEITQTEKNNNLIITEDNNVISIKIKNEKETLGKYNVVLNKTDLDGNILDGSIFKINGVSYNLLNGTVELVEDEIITSVDNMILEYNIEEKKAPEGYSIIEEKNIKLKCSIQNINNEIKITRVNLIDLNNDVYTDEDINLKLNDNTIIIEVKNKPIEKNFDLALRKYITKVNDIKYSREPKVDVSTIATVGTATYKHNKTPIVVQKGDIVTYTIRVYNEGEINGYVDSITDYLPQYLLPIIDGVDGIDSEKYKEEIDFNSNYCWIYLKENNSITTDVTSKLNSEVYSILTKNSLVTDTLLNAFEEGNNELDYIDVEVKCLVSEDVVSGMYLTNIAEITESQDINGNSGDGADSIISNVDFSNLTDYKNNEAINSNNDSYIEGQEDDDDFEKLLVKEFDLSLRKFVTKVNNVLYNRMPIVDTSSLGRIGNNNKLVTTAKYNHTKNPVIVETGDIVTYTIRVYNEGSLDGYANEVIDNVPEGLEFIINNDINLKYKWRMLNANGEETSIVSEAVKIVTDYLSCEENLLKSVKEENGIKVLDYKDIEVQFKVIAVADKNKDNIIKNVAQISADSSNDIDSIPSRNEEYDYIHNTNEDDIDYEPIKLQYFDLALRKFITKVNNLDYNNRIPEIIYNEGSISYKHTKEPVLTRENDIVEYTIRIYNEGEKNGTATEIIDNLPQGLEFILDNETNTKYGWKLIDKDGNEVETLENAVAVKTDYLKNTNIDGIQKNDNGETILKYADVKIAFKVIEKGTSDIIITNIAEISKDSDNDIDSIPNNNIDDEDDIDKEHLKVNYFDLSLKKYVTQSEITLEDKTDIVPTGFNENSEGIAKVDIIASKIKKTNVKFVYNIKITNEGKIAGYATEIKDYIPQGLIFIQEDNPDWKMLEDGNVVTEQLSNTLLNPGESAVVTIKLTWENSVSNLGLKTNYAEISKDSDNDIDSIPDNYTIGEDDIDEAQVILSIKTGPTENYIILTLICISILASGIVLIKKYVL